MIDTELYLQHKGAEQIEVEVDYAGQRIDNFLTREFRGVPKSHIYRILRSGEVRVNKKRVKPTYRVKGGDLIRIPPLRQSQLDNHRRRAPDALLRRLEAAIMLEDNDFIILNKPSGMAAHGGSGLDYGVIEIVRQSRPFAPLLELGHRLDRETSGCLVIAKSRSALINLHRLFRDGKVEKHYLVLVAGHWQGGVRSVGAPLAKLRCRNGLGKVVVENGGAKAETIFSPIRAYRNASLLSAQTRTGRTHQIRVHAAHLGHAVAGDDKYGDFEYNRYMRTFGLRRLFLHASRLAFRIPDSGRCYAIDATLDPLLRQVLLNVEMS
jgi:23S rRNA pseudouridine955/2504/2580 synthase